jgi:hypothetical protein
MSKRRFKWLVKLSQLAALSFIVLPFTLASTSSYFLDASRLEIQASPQTNVASGSVKVSSNSERTIRLKVIPRLWWLNPQGVLVYRQSAQDGYNLLQNIRVNPEEFELLPGQSRLVRFIVRVAPDAPDAEYPFQLYFEPTSLLEPDTQKPNASVSNVLDVIPVFTTTVYAYQGNPQPKTEVTQFGCGYQADSKMVSVDLTLNNKGGKHARLFGNVILSRKQEASGNPLLEVLHLQNSALIIIFPDTPRQVQNLLPLKNGQNLEAGQYKLELALVDERNLQPAVDSLCEFTVP